MNPFYLTVALGTGAAIAVQALANSRLRLALGHAGLGRHRRSSSSGWRCSSSSRSSRASRLPTLMGCRACRAWGWVGGAVGALFIVVSIVLTPRLGTALTLATITVGQMLAALVLDHYGWLGAPVVRLSLPRALGAACLLAGIALMRWK